MRKKKPKTPIFSIEIIEEAKDYLLLAKNHIHRGIHIGNREQLARVLVNIPIEMIVATTGTSDKCLILVDYELGELMDIIFETKEIN